jgi:two-component system sensor histidine kinase GlrK
MPVTEGRSYYPASFLRLLLLAFAVVALPLVLAFVSAALYVERLAEQSQTAVGQAAQAARESRLLMEQVTGLERAARQYLILNDAALLDDYDRVRQQFKRTTSALSLLPLDDPQLRELNRTIDIEQQLYEKLRALSVAAPVEARASPKSQTQDRRAAQTALIDGYIALADLARAVLDTSNALIDREIGQLHMTAGRAQRILWWQLLATIPAGVLLAIGVSFFVARPIRQLDHAIRGLGSGEFGQGIRVGGPSDLAYLGERLEWLRGRLVALEAQKRQFLGHVSHELKTPLTSLCEGSDLLADGTAGPLSDKQRDIVAILQKQSARLQQLIEGLLNYQRAQDSVGQLHLEQVEFDRIVAVVAEDHRLAADAAGVRIDLDVQPVLLRADGDKLRIVVDNLLSNAIKYSPQGAAIELSLAQGRDAIVLDVIDAGPGIAVADREHVFDWYFRGVRGARGRLEGSGLGLAIVRDFVLAHGGRVEIVSDRQNGAHFRVSLPVELAEG